MLQRASKFRSEITRLEDTAEFVLCTTATLGWSVVRSISTVCLQIVRNQAPTWTLADMVHALQSACLIAGPNLQLVRQRSYSDSLATKTAAV